jgi:hypothetical protein
VSEKVSRENQQVRPVLSHNLTKPAVNIENTMDIRDSKDLHVSSHKRIGRQEA